MQDVVVTLDGRDITSMFKHDDNARTLTRLVGGLNFGENRLRVALKGRGRHGAGLTLVNYPKEGPVFSGPYQTPFACETHKFTVSVTGVKLDATSEPVVPQVLAIADEPIRIADVTSSELTRSRHGPLDTPI